MEPAKGHQDSVLVLLHGSMKASLQYLYLDHSPAAVLRRVALLDSMATVLY